MKRFILLLSGILIFSICTGFVSCDKKKPTQSFQDCPLTCRRGDINYNTIPYEVADVVLLAHYFIEGLAVFSPDSAARDYQICTSDVNKDCQVLTLSDLVYLVRTILHNAIEIKDTSPSSELIFFIVRNNNITTCCSKPIGAIRFEFDSLVVPTLLATDMYMLNKDNTVLIWSGIGSGIGNCIDNKDKIISFTGNVRLKKVEAADCDSRELKNLIVIQSK